MAIILDAMGSDKRPNPELQAAVDAARLYGEEIILVGNEAVLKPQLDALNTEKFPVSIVHAPESIDMTDHIEDVRKKKQNTMRVGLELLQSGRASAFVTAGNTGMTMYHAKKILDDIPGVIRPALTALFPVKNGHCVVLDIGANAECRPEFLLQFALMGSIYAEKMLGKKNPRVGLLSNGEEAGKGNELVKATYPLLSNSGLNFIGNVEGKELFGGEADVVVTDGFTGNVLLKTSEAVSRLLIDTIKEGLMSSLTTKLGAALAKPAFTRVKKMMDPSEVGAAPLLGVNGLVFVGHGRSDAKALTSAIRVARQAVEADLLTALHKTIQDRISMFEGK
ncbi:MAG TPA: phosphate acyltransferase PlsX [Anaerolineaceae bacterium]|nr:phosphate acyltransferase PlsX [Anaerolineaceae bacterium]HPN50826.1 phosphate acyltransferase PlsX [Anaerolineaceae bacterium]